jgi:hypothetical protein
MKIDTGEIEAVYINNASKNSKHANGTNHHFLVFHKNLAKSLTR